MESRTTKLRFPTISFTHIKWSLVGGVIAVAALLAVVFRNQWLPQASGLLATATRSSSESSEPAGHDDHAGHAHVGDEQNSLKLSPQARKNIGLKTAAVKLQPYLRSLSIPAIVIGRPGRAQIEVTATLGGRVTRVYPVEGEAVVPGQPLFDLRLTHEELVRAQSDLLRSAERLDVELREIRRLETLAESGAIPGKRLLERQYEKQKIEADLNAQRQSLLLHGLTDKQVDNIVKNRTLVQDITVVAPEHPEGGHAEPHDHPFTVRSLYVKPGQYVNTGDPLCLLMDYYELYIQGRGFEQDSNELVKAAQEGWKVTAVAENHSEQPEVIEGLKIVYVDSEIEPDSRALHFYVTLPNKVVHESKSSDGHRFLMWKHKPGQRMQVRVPVEKWDDRIVLPIDAVAKEGAEYYVFQQNGDHFDRVPVHVEYQDQLWTVIANDGAVFPGDTVAVKGAQQLQMALKNKAGGGVDPHAGHTH